MQYIFCAIHNSSIFVNLQVIDFERDFEQLKMGEKTVKDIPYHNVLGFKKDLTGPEVPAHLLPKDTSDSGSDASEGK